MRVRWVPVVVAPALVLLLWCCLCSGSGACGGRFVPVFGGAPALVLVFRPAPVASCTILLTSAK